MDEHKLIMKVLGAMENYGQCLSQKDAKIVPEDLGKFVTFLSEFADKCHHGKEEDILYEEMAQNGFPKNVGPLAVMFHEHTEGRKLISLLREESLDPTNWNDVTKIISAINGYVELLREHIYKEDNILYPMADERFSVDIMASIGKRFEEYEQEKMGSPYHEKLHSLGEELIARYGGNKNYECNSGMFGCSLCDGE